MAKISNEHEDFFALATADIYIDTRQGRQGGMRQVLHYITCASLR